MSVRTELRAPLHEGSHDSWQWLSPIATRRIAFKAVNDLKGNRIELVKMKNVRHHGSHRWPDNHRPLSKEIARNPASTHVASYRTRALSPLRIEVEGAKNQYTLFVVKS
jgi:hypothetical protein